MTAEPLSATFPVPRLAQVIAFATKEPKMTDHTRGPSRATPRAEPTMPLDPDQFQRLVLNGLEEVKTSLEKLSDQGAAHNTRIAMIERDIIVINQALKGENGEPGLVRTVADHVSFKRTALAFLVVGGGLFTVATALSPVFVASYLDGQAKLRDAARQADMNAYMQKASGGRSSMVTTFEQTSPIPPPAPTPKP